jgi:hypothetical protein
MSKRKSSGGFVNRFARRGWWKLNLKGAADADIKEAEREGAACAESKTVFIKDGTLVGPGVDAFTYQMEINIERTVSDIEEDSAPLVQTLAPIYSVYMGGLEKLGVVTKKLDAAEARYDEAKAGREKNQARLDLEEVSSEYDFLFGRLEQLRLQAEENGLSDLRAIQGTRLTEALRRRAHQDYLRASFVKGACSVLGEGCESSRISLRSVTGVLDTYIDQLEGRCGDGRWAMDFTQHLRHRKGGVRTQTILSEELL